MSLPPLIRGVLYFMEEIWKDVVGYEGLYQVSNMGRLKGIQNGRDRIMKDFDNNHGYRITRISKNGVSKGVKIHRLVVMAFIDPNIPSDRSLVVDHIDGNRANNRLDNLQVITMYENNMRGNIYKSKTSKYFGIYWCNTKKRWKGHAKINGIKKHICQAKTEEEAAVKYRKYFESRGIEKPLLMIK